MDGHGSLWKGDGAVGARQRGNTWERPGNGGAASVKRVSTVAVQHAGDVFDCRVKWLQVGQRLSAARRAPRLRVHMDELLSEDKRKEACEPQTFASAR
jgi:hypothetical protein